MPCFQLFSCPLLILNKFQMIIYKKFYVEEQNSTELNYDLQV